MSGINVQYVPRNFSLMGLGDVGPKEGTPAPAPRAPEYLLPIESDPQLEEKLATAVADKVLSGIERYAATWDVAPFGGDLAKLAEYYNSPQGREAVRNAFVEVQRIGWQEAGKAVFGDQFKDADLSEMAQLLNKAESMGHYGGASMNPTQSLEFSGRLFNIGWAYLYNLVAYRIQAASDPKLKQPPRPAVLKFAKPSTPAASSGITTGGLLLALGVGSLVGIGVHLYHTRKR